MCILLYYYYYIFFAVSIELIVQTLHKLYFLNKIIYLISIHLSLLLLLYFFFFNYIFPQELILIKC